MFVCICAGITDRKLRQLAKSGMSVHEVMNHCQAGKACGSCICDVKRVVEESETESSSGTSDKATG